MKYEPKDIEKKWQKIWEQTNSFKIDKDSNTKEKFYILDMFPYPSGTGLHMGHTESYTASDVFYRFKKMRGFNVLHPQGFDSFGLPAENYAIKNGVKPVETTQKNIINYIKQMKSLGFDYDFDEKVITSDPGYYKWTQWIFGKFFEKGLVYKKTQKTNWCSSCQTVIANEQVVDGKCERCGTEIIQKEVPGWFFKITDFADDLIDGLGKVDWPEYTKKNQINWIGKSQGALLKFQIKDSKEIIEVFTTRPDTLFGVTYMVLSPEHKLLYELKDKISNWNGVEKYIIQTQNKTELDRMEAKEKTGEKLESVMAINPATGQEIPIFIADYVLAGYGTGAIMAVPAHDDRDWAFAKKYNLPIVEVISGGEVEKEAYVENGELVNSGEFNGLSVEEAKQKISEMVGGKMTATYRLRDWSFSRQRYWGCPIPIVYSPEGEAKLVPEKYLPWMLPEDVDFVPTGVAPLSKSEELKKRVEEIFGQGWTAEYDTMDTFVDSSWYFLRYPDPHNEEKFCADDRLKKWMPVDLYIGGAEHTYMHLLYARFFTKAMKKIGLIDFDEPFLKLRHQGMVLDKEGKKMSKSKGNVVNPDSMVEKFGADSVRTYMLFAAPLEDEVMWNEENIVGVKRFLDRTFGVLDFLEKAYGKEWLEKWISGEIVGGTFVAVKTLLNKSILKVTKDIEEFKFNTAISQLMILRNAFHGEDGNSGSIIAKDDFEKFLIMLAPFAPHMAEELWEKLGHNDSIFSQSWPTVDEKYLQDEEIEMVVQVNGKVRDRLMLAHDVTEDEAKETALESEKVKIFTNGKEIKKVIFVPGKLISIVVN